MRREGEGKQIGRTRPWQFGLSALEGSSRRARNAPNCGPNSARVRPALELGARHTRGLGEPLEQKLGLAGPSRATFLRAIEPRREPSCRRWPH